MRAVYKGTTTQVFTNWNQARDPMVARIGWYCSYCEMSVSQMIAIEHIVPRDNGGAPLDWENFLLSCVYCNSVKKARNVSRAGYFWPDIDNTDLAFLYDKTEAVVTVPGPTQVAAESTIDLTGLDRMPGAANTPTNRDSRWIHRLRVWLRAERCLEIWQNHPQQHTAELISMIAAEMGFYSVWTTVFAAEAAAIPIIKSAFIGTYEVYEANGARRIRANGLV